MGDDTTGWLASRALEETPREVASRYDEWAQRYEADVRSWGYTVPEDIVALLLQRNPQGLVLDAGCGVGMVGRALVDSGIPGDGIVGVDASTESLRLASRLGLYDHLACVDLNGELPFDSGTFGGVVCGGVLTYLPDTEHVVGELLRVTQVGAPVVVSQRTDLWAERGCDRVFENFAAIGVEVQVHESVPYLPGHDDYADAIRVIFVSMAKP